MSEKKIKTRIQQKHDIEINWMKATTFIPMAGEIIVYDVDDNYNYERFKIGDGITTVNKLPFATNIKNIIDTGTSGVSQIPDNVADGFDFTGKNPNATELDSSLTGKIAYGATGAFASAFGGKSAAMGKRSHAEGTTTIAKGSYSHAEGDNSVALGNDSHAEGYATVSAGIGSHSEGHSTVAGAPYTHAEGIRNRAELDAAHVEGEDNRGRGWASHTEGKGNIVEGDYAHGEGSYNTVNATSAHAEGQNNCISEGAEAAHVSGRDNSTTHAGAQLLGRGLISGRQDQVVVGQYNTYDDNSIFIVGNGTEKDLPSNAFVVKKNGSLQQNTSTALGKGAVALGYNTTAISDGATTTGDLTIAGSKAFTITDLDITNKSFVLDSIAGLDVGDIYSCHISFANGSRQFENVGKITVINGNNVTVDVFPVFAESLGAFKREYNFIDETGLDMELNTFRIIAKPRIGTRTIGYGAFTTGISTQALSKGAHTEGCDNVSYGSYAHTEGTDTKAGYCAHAEGRATTASGFVSHAEGQGTTSSGVYSHAEGAATVASGQSSHVEGYDTIVEGDYAHAEGEGGYRQDLDTGALSTTERAAAVGVASHIEGSHTHAEGNRAHAEGYATYAKGISSHAEGHFSYAQGQAAHAEGGKTKALAEYAHAEGVLTTAEGTNGSHAEGYQTTASGQRSHAEGSKTSATNTAAHAEGGGTTASGACSHAEGNGTTASHENSHAGGQSTKTSRKNQTVIGEHNTDNSNALLIVGNGSSSNKTNALEVLKDGRVTLGTTPTAAMDAANKKYVDDTVAANKVELNLKNGLGEGSIQTDKLSDSIVTAAGVGSTAFGNKIAAYGNYSHAEGFGEAKAVSYTAETLTVGSVVTDVDLYLSVSDYISDTTDVSGLPVIIKFDNGDALEIRQNSFGFVYANNEVYKSVFIYVDAYDCWKTETYLDDYYEDSLSTEQRLQVSLNNSVITEIITPDTSGSSHIFGNAKDYIDNSNITISGILYSGAHGYVSHAEGFATTASGEASHTEGANTTASGNQSHAEGSLTQALGIDSHAEGHNTTAEGDYTHAEGLDTSAIGARSHAEGFNSKALKIAAHAEGGNTTASGECAHAEGNGTTAEGNDAHAEGNGTKATKQAAHAEGMSTNALAQAAHAEGLRTTASQPRSHAGGTDTFASHTNAFAHGQYLNTSNVNQFVVGNFNKYDSTTTNALFMVGNGTADADNKRSNAFVVNKNGTASLGADPINDLDVATKRYIDQLLAQKTLVTIYTWEATD